MLLLSAKSLLILLLICVCCEGFVLSKIDVNARLQQTKNEKDLEGIRGLKGYYRRPSRAIEKGGGFFVPGLEGEKIRIVSAAFLIAAFALNRAGIQESTIPQVVSEMTGVAASLLLFADGISKAFPAPIEMKPSSSNYLSLIQSTFTQKAGIAQKLATAIIQTVSGVQCVVAIDTNANYLEIGPVTSRQLSVETCQQIRNLAQGFSKDKFIEVEPTLPAMLGEALSSSSIERVTVICRGSYDWVWVIVSDDKTLSDRNSQLTRWILDLVRAPLE